MPWKIARAVRKSLRQVATMRSGQITKNHDIGKWIAFVSSLPNINSIVEIGTWNGRGSSKAIVRGVKSRSKSNRSKVRVFGYEINPDMAKAAKKALRNSTFFEVVFGSIVNVEDLDRSNLSAAEKSWLDQDIFWMKNAPNVLSTVPLSIDLLILDGGEFSTLSEFNALNSRVTHWMILDDTKTRKCAEIVRLVRESKNFEVVYESDERHGTAILKRKHQSKTTEPLGVLR